MTVCKWLTSSSSKAQQRQGTEMDRKQIVSTVQDYMVDTSLTCGDVRGIIAYAIGVYQDKLDVSADVIDTQYGRDDMYDLLRSCAKHFAPARSKSAKARV